MNHSYNDILLGYEHGRPVFLSADLLCRHLYCLGATGTGKTALLRQIAHELIRMHHITQAGALILDPFGSLADSLIAYCAAEGFDNLPIIPIDLRKLWVVPINPLRTKPGVDPAPKIHSAVRATLHGWKQSATVDTPRLTKWCGVFFTTIHACRCTLVEALDMIRSPEIRRAMARHVEDDMASAVWEGAPRKESEFQTVIESFTNRMVRLLSTYVLKLAFGQENDISLDMSEVIAKGQIIVAALATEGSRVDEEDANVVGSLLLSQVWDAAKIRRERERDPLKTFTVIADEFHDFVNPVIAKGMAQARSMGIAFVAAHQSMTQLEDHGPIGRQILNSVLANAATKIIFQAQHPEDVEVLTPWIFRNEVNPNEIKYQHVSRKVVDHEIRYFISDSESTTQGTSDAVNWSTTDSASHSVGTSLTHTDGIGLSHTDQHGHSVNDGLSLTNGDSHSEAESAAESNQEGTTASRAMAKAHQRNSNKSESRTLDGDLSPCVGKDAVTDFDGAYNDLEEYPALRRTLGSTASEGDGETASESTGEAKTQSTSKARAVQRVASSSKSLSASVTASDSEGESDAVSLQSSDSESTSEINTVGVAMTEGGSHSNSTSVSKGTARVPMLVPVYGTEAEAPQFRSVNEQLFIFGQHIASQPDRNAIVRIGIGRPIRMQTVPLSEPAITAKGAAAWTRLRLKKVPYALPAAEADRRLIERRRKLETTYFNRSAITDPTSARRRVVKEAK
jgi:hypothetical protein